MSVPKPGQYGEPLVADIRGGCYAIYPESRGHENCLAGADDWALAYQAARGTETTLSEEQIAFALRIIACINALNGRDPETLRELEMAAKAAERVMSCVSDAEEETRAALRLRAALKAFGAWS